MQGKTKGFFEDIFVLAILASLGWGAYTLFFTQEDIAQTTTANIQIEPTPQQLPNEQKTSQQVTNNAVSEELIKEEKPIEAEVVVDETLQESKEIELSNDVAKKDQVLEDENLKEITTTKEIITNEVKEKQNIQNSEEKVIETKQKIVVEKKQKVDLAKLQQFLIETKQKIKDAILIKDENNEESKMLSIRLTLLKNGNFEQLIHTGGDVDIFKNNYENIVKVSPLKIDENIVGDFPRYLRYRFQFNKKDE